MRSAASTVSGSELLTGSRQFGGYEVLGEIGRGGMGKVYRARQTSLDRIVALKVIAAGEMASPKMVERFQTEAEAAASLDHPNIVSIYEVGEQDEWNFFSMRLVEGQTLSQTLAGGPLPFERAARLLATVARAIQHAHERGVLHRDLKPGNIMLDTFGEPHVTDFGLAKFTQRESDLTLTHTALGTPAYMSPEQAAGRTKEITTAADIYGLGAVLFEMLTGTPPFAGETPMAIARQVIDEEASSPSSVNPAVPLELAVICLKCLEKEPARRYRSAAALADDLERWLRHEPISAHATTPVERLGKWVHRKPIHAALAATVVMAMVSLIIGLLWHNRRITRAQQATEVVNRELATHLRQVEWQQAEAALAGRTADAMAMFARFLRETPGDQIVAKRLISLLELRAFPLPALPPLKHGFPVNLVRMDGNGRHLFTIADDGVLRSWSLTNGVLEKEARLDLGHDYLLRLPNGNHLLAATRKGRVIIWDFQQWQLERELGDIPTLPGKLSMSEDGRLVSLVTPKDEVQLWEAATGKLLSRTNLPINEIFLATTLGSDGEAVIKGRLRGVWLWRPGKEELVPLLGLNEGPVNVACDWPRRRVFVSLEATHGTTTRGIVSLNLDTRQEIVRKADAMPWDTMHVAPDGRRLLVSRWGEGVNVLDADTLSEQVPTFAGAPIVAKVSPDGTFRVGFRGLHDGSGRLYDLSNGQPLMEPIQHEGTIASHELSPDGKLLVTASQDGTARLWDVRMRSSDSTHIQAVGWIHRLALSPDGQRLAAAVDHEARIYDTTTGQALFPPMIAKDVIFDVNFSPDGRFLAVACFDNSIRVLNSRTGETTSLNETHERRAFLAVFSPDGRSVASASEDATARVFEAASGRPLFPPLKHENAVTDVCFSPDNKVLATASVDATARLWDAATGLPIGPALRHQGTVWTAQFSADGRRLLTASYDRTAQIWDVRTGNRAAPPIRSDQGLLGAVFSGDGQRVLIHTLNSARIFNAQTSEPLTPPMRHANRVTRARFSPDGHWVATIAEDLTARVWDARSGFPATEPLMHLRMVTSLAWLPDSRRLLTGSQDGRIRLWKLPEIDSVAGWLPDLAEALAGKRDDGKGGRISVPTDRLDALRQLAETNGDDTPRNRWLRWFLIERLQGTVP